MNQKYFTDDVLAFIVAHKQMHDGMAPTVREIADELGIASNSTVHYHLQQLEKDGRILRNHNIPRGISVPGGRWVYEPQGEDA
jgi:SOS-response transcriptional repressor LexA